MMRSARACISGSFTKACWKASLQSGVMWAWWIAISNGRSGPGRGLNLESVSGMTISFTGWYWIVRSYPCRHSIMCWSHAGMSARFFLEMEFKWLVVWFDWEWPSIDVSVEICSALKTTASISLSLCLHICILHQWVLCLQKLWVCCFVRVLCLGLPGKHRLV